MFQKKTSGVRPPKLSSLTLLSPPDQDQVVASSATSPNPFNEEPNADTMSGQLSNAHNSTAMTKSLSIESSPLTLKSGSSYGMIVQEALQAMMLTRRQELNEELLNRACATTLPPETAEEQAIMSMPLAQTAEDSTQGGLFGRDSLLAADGIT